MDRDEALEQIARTARLQEEEMARREVRRQTLSFALGLMIGIALIAFGIVCYLGTQGLI